MIPPRDDRLRWRACNLKMTLHLGTCLALCIFSRSAAASHGNGAVTGMPSAGIRAANSYYTGQGAQDARDGAVATYVESSEDSAVAGGQEPGGDGNAAIQSWSVVKCCYSNRMMSQADYSVRVLWRMWHSIRGDALRGRGLLHAGVLTWCSDALGRAQTCLGMSLAVLAIECTSNWMFLTVLAIVMVMVRFLAIIIVTVLVTVTRIGIGVG